MCTCTYTHVQTYMCTLMYCIHTSLCQKSKINNGNGSQSQLLALICTFMNKYAHTPTRTHTT